MKTEAEILQEIRELRELFEADYISDERKEGLRYQILSLNWVLGIK